MRTLLTVLLLSLAPALPARATMHDAIIASEMLLGLADARVVRVHVSDKVGADTPIYGVVYAFQQLCWLYVPELGNRVLGEVSTEWTRSEWLLPAIRRSVPAVTAVEVYPATVSRTHVPGQDSIPNACVIGSLAALQNRLIGGAPVHEAGLVLLSYWRPDAATASNLIVDHCVLVVRAGQEWSCVDPRAPHVNVALETVAIGAPVDPKLLQVALTRLYPLKSARLLLLDSATLDQISRRAGWRAGIRDSALGEP